MSIRIFALIALLGLVCSTATGQVFTKAVAAAPYTPIGFTQGAVLLGMVSGCDDCVEEVTLARYFPWYCAAASLYTLRVSSNGQINVDSSVDPNCCVADPLDGSAYVGQRIAVLQQDLDPAGVTGGDIWFRDTGSSVIVSYENVSFFPGPSTGSVNAQVEMFDSGEIEIRYGAIDAAGRSAACGLQRSVFPGTIWESPEGFMPGFNSVGLSANPDLAANSGCRFIPNCLWKEVGDAGSAPVSAAQAPAEPAAGNFPLTWRYIVGSLGAGDSVDLFRIRITDLSQFQAVTYGTTWDTQLFLFNADGSGQVHNDDLFGLHSAIFSFGVFSTGIYYLGISASNRDPVDAGGGPIFGTATYPLGLPGQQMPIDADPLDSWVGPSLSSGAYRIAIGGAEFCPFPQYQMNNPPACSHAYNGVESDGTSPAIVDVCEGELLSSLLTGTGLVYECAISSTGCVGRCNQFPTFTTPTQTINLDLTGPPSSLLYFNGALAGTPAVATLVHLTGPVSYTFAATTFGLDSYHACKQGIIIDATHADGFRLTQASSVSIWSGNGGPVPGPVNDNESVEISTEALNCGPITFCGTQWTSFFVNENGYVTFGSSGGIDFSPTPADFVGDQFGKVASMWSAMIPGVSTSITATAAGGVIKVDYVDQGSFAVAGAASDHSICFDTCTGNITISLAPDPNHNWSTLVGLSCGAPVATDPGSQTLSSFVGSGPQTSALATDAVYEFAISGAPTGFSSISFTNGDGSVFEIF